VTLTKVKTAWRKLLVTHNTQTNSQKIDKRRFSYMVRQKPSADGLVPFNLKKLNSFYLFLGGRSMA
jgi:phage terminase large subunit GpA-like protein